MEKLRSTDGDFQFVPRLLNKYGTWTFLLSPTVCDANSHPWTFTQKLDSVYIVECKGDPWIKDTSLIMALDQVSISYEYVLLASWDEENSLIRDILGAQGCLY